MRCSKPHIVAGLLFLSSAVFCESHSNQTTTLEADTVSINLSISETAYTTTATAPVASSTSFTQGIPQSILDLIASGGYRKELSSHSALSLSSGIPSTSDIQTALLTSSPLTTNVLDETELLSGLPFKTETDQGLTTLEVEVLYTQDETRIINIETVEGEFIITTDASALEAANTTIAIENSLVITGTEEFRFESLVTSIPNANPSERSLSGDQDNSSGSIYTTTDSANTKVRPSLSIIPEKDEAEDIVEDSSFLSFEEWKRKKAGEDANFQKSTNSNKKVARPPQRQENNNLNGPLGDEMEIELSMFTTSTHNSDPEDQDGKLYKGKFNYASFDCAATIVKTNSEAKSASALLNENKDTYLLNECSSANKFVIIELCEDILVSEILIGNYEFFSSTFHNLRFSVSDRFPVSQGGWKVLGNFEAENLRNLQTFPIKNPLIWAKYLRVEVLSVYGNEFYCPITTIQVHGTTMIEQFKMEEEAAAAEEEKNFKSEEIGELDETLEDIPEFKLFDKNQGFNYLDDLSDNIRFVTTQKDGENNVKSQDEFSNTLSYDENEDDCRVTPYLGLNEFLKDLSPEEYCVPQKQIQREIEIDSGFEPGSVVTDSKPMTQTSNTEPVTQESIYKSIAKRLSLLESNATLSLLYIEEQSKFLSAAFDKLEDRQKVKFEKVLSNLNSTIYEQVELFNAMHSTFTQRAANLLNVQSVGINKVLEGNSKQLSDLSQQLTSQRRLGWMNTFIIVSLLVYIVITRDTYIETDFIGDFAMQGHEVGQIMNGTVDPVSLPGSGASSLHGYSWNRSPSPTMNEPPASPVPSSVYYRKKGKSKNFKELSNLIFDNKYTHRIYSFSSISSNKEKDVKITLDQVNAKKTEISPTDSHSEHDYTSDAEYNEDDDYHTEISGGELELEKDVTNKEMPSEALVKEMGLSTENGSQTNNNAKQEGTEGKQALEDGNQRKDVLNNSEIRLPEEVKR